MPSFLSDLPRLFPRPEQTIAGTGRLLRQGEVTCVDILNACLEQVDTWEPKVHAWVVLDREGAMAQARALDEELRSGNDRGALHGIPVGIKDIIDVKGLPSACGAKRWANRIAQSDFWYVSWLRDKGAVILGKAVTTPYAWIDPPVTRNPWNTARTPGGSSSGPAAAVACGMCYGALGSQTGGSITRPASFCGVAGMKLGWYPLAEEEGILPFAPSLDHVGPIARTVDDLLFLYEPPHDFRPSTHELKEFRPPRLVRFRGFFDVRSEPAMAAAFEECLRVLEERGAELSTVDDPVDFEQVLRDHRLVMAAEAANVHSDWLDEYPDDYPPRITSLVAEGRSVSALAYLRARDRRDPTVDAVHEGIRRNASDAIITPATIGVAPDPTTTGDPAFNSPWSYTGLPTLSVPIALSTERLPLAIQLVGGPVRDTRVLRVARWCEAALRSSHQ